MPSDIFRLPAGNENRLYSRICGAGYSAIPLFEYRHQQKSAIPCIPSLYPYMRMPLFEIVFSIVETESDRSENSSGLYTRISRECFADLYATS